MRMLQKALLAVMAVVIAAAVWGFYATPSPILYDSSKVNPDNVRVEWMRPTGKYTRPESVEVSDSVDREAVIEILSRYTRERSKFKISGYTLTAGEIDLSMHVEGFGPLHVVLGADDGTLNMMYSSADQGCYEIINSDALLAELTVLLPD